MADDWDAVSTPLGNAPTGALRPQAAPDWDSVSVAVSSPESSPSFINKIGASLKERGKEGGQTIDDYKAGKISLPEAGLQILGKPIAGTATDAIGAAGSSLYHTLVPDSVQQGISNRIDDGKHTGLGQAVGAVADTLGKQYQDFSAAHPEEAKNAESIANVIGLAPVVKGVAGLLGAGEDAAKAEAATAMPSAANAKSATVSINAQTLSAPMQKVYDRLAAKYPDKTALRSALLSYQSGNGKALIDIGGDELRNLAEGAATFPSGDAKASAFFDGKISEAGDQLKQKLGKTVSPNDAYHATLDDIVNDGRAKAGPLYEKAYSENQQVVSPIIDRILQTPAGKSALSEAARDMQNEMSLLSKPDPELTAAFQEVRDLGLTDQEATGVGVGKGLKLKTLDYIKRAMDSSIKKNLVSDPAEAKRIGALKNGIVREIDAQDKGGTYAKARGAAGDYFKLKDAAESGASFLSDDAETVARNIAAMSPQEQRSYRVGVVKSLRDKIDNTTDGRNVAAIFNKPSTRQKLQSMLSESDYMKLHEHAQATDDLYKLRNQITGNSRTALRGNAAAEFTPEGIRAIESVADRGVTGAGINAVKEVLKSTFKGMSDQMAGDVAEIVFETDPKKKYQIVKQLVAQSNFNPSAARREAAAKTAQAFFKTADTLAHPAIRGVKTLIPAATLNAATPSPVEAISGGESLAAGGDAGNDTIQPVMPSTLPTPSGPPITIKKRKGYGDALIGAESNGDPNAVPRDSKTGKVLSSARGAAQFIDSTMHMINAKYGKEYGLSGDWRGDPEKSKLAAQLYAYDNAQTIKAKTGRDIVGNAGEVYVSHVFGPGGFIKLAQNPDVPAIALFPPKAGQEMSDEVRNNKSLFYSRSGNPLSAKEVFNRTAKRVSNG